MHQAGACCGPWKAPYGDDSLVDSAAGLCMMVLTPVTQADAEAIAVLMAEMASAGLKGYPLSPLPARTTISSVRISRAHHPATMRDEFDKPCASGPLPSPSRT